MLRFRFIFSFTGLCLLNFPGQIFAAADQPDLALAITLPQNSRPLHAGLGILALVLAAMGWVRRCRRRKSP